MPCPICAGSFPLAQIQQHVDSCLSSLTRQQLPEGPGPAHHQHAAPRQMLSQDQASDAHVCVHATATGEVVGYYLARCYLVPMGRADPTTWHVTLIVAPTSCVLPHTVPSCVVSCLPTCALPPPVRDR